MTKRLFDIGVALAILIIALPVLILIVLLLLPQPLYLTTRVGPKGESFRMIKFRKFKRNASGLPLTSTEDERFTRLGRLLHRLHLDELPNLLNVLRGDMSLVGPRPEDPVFVTPEHFSLLRRVRPGLTGAAQVSRDPVLARERDLLAMMDEHHREDFYRNIILPRKLEADFAYQPSLLGDIKILIETVRS